MVTGTPEGFLAGLGERLAKDLSQFAVLLYGAQAPGQRVTFAVLWPECARKCFRSDN